MGKVIAKVISIFFHPLLMPSYLLMSLMWYAPSLLIPIDRTVFPYLLLVVALTSFVLPMIMLTSLRLFNIIPDFYLDNKNHRVIPFIFIAILYGVSYYMFYHEFNFAKIVYQSYFSISLLIIILTIITFYWKISVHSAALAGSFGILYAYQLLNPDIDLLYMLAGLLIIIGVVGSSRMKLNAHTLWQIIVGSIVGFVCCFLTILIWGLLLK